MKPWHLGNTTVRSPFRLREGLVALSTSSLQGNLRGQDIAFRVLLGEHGIVSLGEDVTNSVGRKWRSALGKMGFLYPEIPDVSGLNQTDLGQVDTITPNGWRLICASTVPAMQECFLRALSAHYIPSILEKNFDFSVFSPLRHTLSIMLELERQSGDSRLNFIEMASIVQLTNGSDDIKCIASTILDFRSRREKQNINKRKFDTNVLNELALTVLKQNGKPYEAQTFKDYADTNIRYIKATGLVQSRGRGISLTPEKHLFIEKLIQEVHIPESVNAYFITLCNGAILPTDNRDSALAVLEDLLIQLNNRGISFDISTRTINTSADIEIIRHEIENILALKNEEEYADKQALEWEEIAAYMDLISARKSRKILKNGEIIEIPQAEAPAYFEWVLWRAFLAINSLANKPYEARRFKVDQDFLPVGTAPGNGPDLVFEFDEFVLVVEVTLTTNSRQEAAEGEPVRRHVANLVTAYQEKSGKQVYGLFIANKIDSNTAETFRIGIWFTNNDDEMKLEIIPVTLIQFKGFFEAMFKSQHICINLIRELLEECGVLRSKFKAPAWKSEIEKTVQQNIDRLFATQYSE